jgi:single-strand DNA-binding protein
MLNNAVIMGRLTKDPELKTTANGISVTSFTIAVDRKFNKQGEEKQADFIDIIAWRGTAEFISKYFRKGSMIAVQGSIQTRMYEDKNGNKRKAVEIVADEVSFCGDKNINAAPAPTTPTITPSDEEYRDIPEDDLPF